MQSLVRMLRDVNYLVSAYKRVWMVSSRPFSPSDLRTHSVQSVYSFIHEFLSIPFARHTQRKIVMDRLRIGCELVEDLLRIG